MALFLGVVAVVDVSDFLGLSATKKLPGQVPVVRVACTISSPVDSKETG